MPQSRHGLGYGLLVKLRDQRDLFGAEIVMRGLSEGSHPLVKRIREPI
jgi:hypothetical protein